MEDLFPHEKVRENQKELIEKVKDTIQAGKNLLAHAPTGLGKTAATVPQALSYALEKDKTVFFLTPRHSQHEIVVETLKEIREKHGKQFVSVDLIGKEWLCEGTGTSQVFVEEEPDCPRHEATYTDNHQLTKLAKKKKNKLKNQILRAEEVKEKCSKVCPYSILTHTVGEADIVIGDYFHIFHPGVRESLFKKGGLSLQDCIIIVDEAHNLPDRTRNLNSAAITENTLKKAAAEASRSGFYNEEENLERLRKGIRKLAKDKLGMESESKLGKKELLSVVNNIQDHKKLKEDLEAAAKEVLQDEDDSQCEKVAYFLDQWEGDDYGFVRTIKKLQSRNNSNFRVSYTCLDPQYATKHPLNKSHASIGMSGTLEPLEMYEDILGMDKNKTEKEKFSSPFPQENKLNLIVDQITTKYKKRDEKLYQKIAWYLKQSSSHIQGNIGVFFPSYSLRDKVHEKLEERIDRKTFLEKRGMDKEDKRKLLERLEEEKGEGGILLGVVGGSFGEGIDYPGDLMRAVFVVGLPLQKPNLETQALIDFYDEKFGRGWDYGYNFPAVNRALQAAGRCIRSENDRGVVVFMDKRYTWSKYRKAMPQENYRVTKSPWQDIKSFFGN
ncbi:MAG: ATP-dependent DNA helicase [Candidatus Nanohaloarchaeota archaeon QJJ-9]|nr:ATP-dependent DNA helicase [Candidatus Nanohaloarchaeota archaeon QJJ-9]